ncbi:MAG: cupredoxin domain-containing protein [Acidobacteria bacterium]|nr:cupredoxin domain-containing protein [Acidobacteriota bacterium]
MPPPTPEPSPSRRRPSRRYESMRPGWVPALIGVLLLGAGIAGARSAGQERVVVSVLAERFSFTPSEIRVPVGVTLELRVRSDDTMHGFRIAGHGVNVAVPKRRQGEAVVEFDARTAGRYRFECSRLCGAGHQFMHGEIVVDPDAND